MTRALTLSVLAYLALATSSLAEPLLVSRTAAYAKAEDAAATAVLRCTLAEFQAKAVRERLAASGIAATEAANDEVPAHGRFLSLRIDVARFGATKALSLPRFVTTTARLYQDGAETAHFTETRGTMRGRAGAGGKSSCRMLASSAHALAGDIQKWLSGVLANESAREPHTATAPAALPPSAN